jgi:hypothetical protein
LEVPIKTKKLLTKSKFLINNRRFYYLLNKTFVQQTLLNYLEALETADYAVRVEIGPHEDQPNMLLIISPISKVNYLKYGDSVYFDVTYNLVREQWHR